ncbi:MAG: DUF2341 domain-containing protein [Polyangiaceae bacterium]|nr:DUF2341 domain-containing protein [Polyangiaceae bacterium]
MKTTVRHVFTFMVLSMATLHCALDRDGSALFGADGGSAGGGGDGLGNGAGGAGTAGGNVVGASSSSSGQGGSTSSPARRVEITFDNQSGPAIDDFPLLVRLDATRIEYARTSPNGADLRFVDADGITVLPHEVEAWNPDGISFVWVLVPDIDATSTDHIFMYYGDPAAGVAPDPLKLWKSFVGVYHLSGSTTVGFDNSPSAHHGTVNGNVTTDMNGRIGEGISLGGSGRIDLTGVDQFSADMGQVRTVEAWYSTTHMAAQRLFSQESNCLGFGMTLGTTNIRYRGSLFTGGGCGTHQPFYAQTNDATADGQWHYVTMVLDRPGSEIRLYLDGMLATSNSIGNGNDAHSANAWIGSAFDGNSAFQGRMDEFRVASKNRSAGWIAAQNRSVRDQFVTYGAPQMP